jgi:hypothetical protein
MACLASGVGVILSYCQGTTSMNAAYPLAGSAMHLDLTINGPGAVGGTALIAAGILLLLWAVVAAFVSQFSLLGGEGRREDYREDYMEPEREQPFEEHYSSGPLGITGQRRTGSD